MFLDRETAVLSRPVARESAAPSGARARILRTALRTSYGIGAIGVVGSLLLSPLVGAAALLAIVALELDGRRFRGRR